LPSAVTNLFPLTLIRLNEGVCPEAMKESRIAAMITG